MTQKTQLSVVTQGTGSRGAYAAHVTHQRTSASLTCGLVFPTYTLQVRDCSSSYDLVITSGGVGPTLDDVTMHGVALAFGQKLIR